MAGKLKLLVCCGNGAGTSMMIKLNVEKVTKKMGLGIQEIRHCAAKKASAPGQMGVEDLKTVLSLLHKSL